MKKNGYLSLFFTMLKIGLFTFGGGYAMIAILENEFVSKKGWIAKDEFLDMVAISESTPGPIAINSATYIGYKLLGIRGALAATVAMCIPSFVIIFSISLFFDAFLSLKAAQYAFRGIQVCVVYLILSAGFKMLGGMKKKPLPVFIFSVVLVSMITLSVLAVSFSSIFYILAAGCVGLIAYLLRTLRERSDVK